MPSHQKTCNICRQPFAAGETRQPHPNANGISYGPAHKRCAGRFTRKGREAITPLAPVTADLVAAAAPPAPVEIEVYSAQYQEEPVEAPPEEKPKRRSRHK